MVTWLYNICYFLVFVTLSLTLMFSFKYRRAQDPNKRGLNAANMNISMGLMLVFIAVVQLFLAIDSYVRLIFGIVCLLLGLFNFFTGLRNRASFPRHS